MRKGSRSFAAEWKVFDRLVSKVDRLLRPRVPGWKRAQSDSDSALKWLCAVWRIDGRVSRELFIEAPGPDELPDRLRVGLYFHDSAEILRRNGLQLKEALRPVLNAAPRLKELGVRPTRSVRGWDTDPANYSRASLSQWLHAQSHKDLVRVFDVRAGYPTPAAVARVLIALVPIWETWNRLRSASTVFAVEEGARREIRREIGGRNQRVAAAARARYGYDCVICGFNFERVYGPSGNGFIEVHHLRPVGEGARVTSVTDVRCVCANCHRMLHRGRRIVSIGGLTRVVQSHRRP